MNLVFFFSTNIEVYKHVFMLSACFFQWFSPSVCLIILVILFFFVYLIIFVISDASYVVQTGI